jgi:hypothetical protein
VYRFAKIKKKKIKCVAKFETLKAIMVCEMAAKEMDLPEKQKFVLALNPPHFTMII